MMNHICRAAVALAATVAATLPVHAAPVIWSAATGGNGHAYDVVFANNPAWTAARLDAASRSYLGQTGYLATFTTRAEQDFVIAALGGGTALNQLWLGGYQSSGSNEPFGGWRWITGEAWRGVAPSDPLLPRSDFGFNNLYFDGGPENVLITWWNSGGINDFDGTPDPGYSDGNGGPARGYIVEFGSVPEPDQWALLLAGFGTISAVLRRRRARNRAIAAA